MNQDITKNMNERELAVWDILTFHKGRDHAIGGKELASTSGRCGTSSGV